MQKRKLGSSDIFVSPITIGCWAFGGGEYWGEQSQSDVNAVVSMAMDAGINTFDTAEVYNNGLSEEALGIALKGRRTSAVIIDKFAPNRAYYKEVLNSCDNSLKRLKTDYIDLYMLHWPINERSINHFSGNENKLVSPPTIEEAMSALNELIRLGKIRAAGISNFGVLQTKEALACGTPIAANQLSYNILSRAIEAEIAPFMLKSGISILGSMTLQQGLLTGKYLSADDVPAHQAHSRHFAQERGAGSRHYTEGAEKEIFTALDELRQMARDLNTSLASLAISWAVNGGVVTSALVGMRNRMQLNENLAALNLELTKAQIAEINRISRSVLEKLGNSPDYYESPENSRTY